MSQPVPLCSLQDVTLVLAADEACALVILLRRALTKFQIDAIHFGTDGSVRVWELREKIISQVEAQREIAGGNTSTTTRE